MEVEVKVEEEEHEMTSLRTRRKKSPVGSIACCFSSTPHHRRRSSFDATFSSSTSIPHPSPRISPSTWIKSMTTDSDIIKGRCRNFISRMTRHRRHSSADFSYDPLSYSLNFHDDAPSSDDEFRAMIFASRLPTSPPTSASRRIPKTLTIPFDPNLPTTPLISCRLLERRRGEEEP
ncbi:UNVERIFIED_CONTAM: hypothetical protein Sradi_5044200 [Sesamum radiatum]|uniref:Ovate family protein n=1 Tax=Sesamum radiatum TaxID=300843 RepID=A0AAW2MGS2_SESRA